MRLQPLTACLIPLHEIHDSCSASLCEWNHSRFVHQHTNTTWAPSGAPILSGCTPASLQAVPQPPFLVLPQQVSPHQSGSRPRRSLRSSPGLSLRIPCPLTTPESVINNNFRGDRCIVPYIAFNCATAKPAPQQDGPEGRIG